jgi:hypothetical protein
MVAWPGDSQIGYLAEVTEGDLIQICWLSPKLRFGSKSESTPRIGEVFQCIQKDAEGFLVARFDGSRVRLRAARQEDICVTFLRSSEPETAWGSRSPAEDGQIGAFETSGLEPEPDPWDEERSEDT